MLKFLNSCTVIVCAILFFSLLPTHLLANDLQEDRAEADQYYQAQRYGDSYKIYYKLAKKGDHHSQAQLATIFSKGLGKKVDLEKAYAWSTLAAEGGDELLMTQCDELLLEVPDKAKAEKLAEKYNKKYGDKALKEREDKRERIKRSHEMGGCTGARLGCARG